MTITRFHAADMLRLLVAALLLPVTLHAQSGVAESQQHLREAARLYKAGDEDGVVRALEEAHSLNPASLYTRHSLAAAHARNGNAERALDLLEGLALARVDFGVADDEDFAALAAHPRFEALLQSIRQRTASVSNSRIHYELQRIDLVPEGIARDANSGRLFIGSMRTGEIFAIDADRQLSKFASLVHDTPLAAIGMAVDEKRELLWVIGAPSFLTEIQQHDAAAWSGVFGFDLVSGEERQRYLRDDAGYGYNDVTVAPNGDLYLSGEKLGVLASGAENIMDLASSAPVYGSNGIVVTPDGEHLITASYPSGIAVIRLTDGETRFLTAPEGIELYGIDGLYLYDGDLIAVQNGIKPWRVMRFEIDPGLTRISDATILDFGNPLMTATTGAIVDGEIHLVGQGPASGDMPSHVPEAIRQYVGRTLIMTAPLD